MRRRIDCRCDDATDDKNQLTADWNLVIAEGNTWRYTWQSARDATEQASARDVMARAKLLALY